MNSLRAFAGNSLLTTLLRRNALACTSYRNKTRVGKYKKSKRQINPVSYEMEQKPWHIGVRKGWLSWHTSNLEEFSVRPGETVAEDIFIRKFMMGTWHNMFSDQFLQFMGERFARAVPENIVIKRRGNTIIIAGIVLARIPARKVYFLIGYTEELLSHLLKQPVKLEFQTIEDRRDIVFKYI